MRRTVGVVEIRQMAGDAGGGKTDVLIVFMTLCTRHRDMRSGERELGHGRMVERRAGPIRGGMTSTAVLREVGSHVRRIVGVVEVCQVARDAGSREPHELIVFVALCAGHGDMSTRKRELGLAVIKLRPVP